MRVLDFSPSPPPAALVREHGGSDGGEGRGEEALWFAQVLARLPLSPALSPLVPRGERESEHWSQE